MAAAIVLLLVVFGLASEHFLTLTNLKTITSQIPTAIIVAVGMTYVLLIGGIDLSVGAVLSLASAVLAVALLRYHVPLPLAILLAALTGTAAGLINGLIAAQWSLPSFIVTLGMMEAARGLAFIVTDSQTQYVGDLIGPIRSASLFGVSAPFLAAIAIAAAGQFVLSHTAFGRQVVAVGHKEEVAYLSGIAPRRVKLIVFTLCGALVGLASVFHTARLSAADPNTGFGFELEAIAAVVIGGTSLSGGRGSVGRSLFGVLVIAILGSGLAQAGAQEPAKRLITGLVIVAAVILDRYRRPGAVA
ncbi:MAG: ABC transporter permease [Candidatus Hydrogenedens sp.]|nr:ABC transporter permease [Candidatus Hydrogenedens sp.]